jgi:hypothetical protein
VEVRQIFLQPDFITSTLALRSLQHAQPAHASSIMIGTKGAMIWSMLSISHKRDIILRNEFVTLV